MAVALSDLIAWRDRLLESRLSGIREARDANGESVTYRSDGEMAAALAAVDRMIADASRISPTTIRFSTSKGI